MEEALKDMAGIFWIQKIKIFTSTDQKPEAEKAIKKFP